MRKNSRICLTEMLMVVAGEVLVVAGEVLMVVAGEVLVVVAGEVSATLVPPLLGVWLLLQVDTGDLEAGFDILYWSIVSVASAFHTSYDSVTSFSAFSSTVFNIFLIIFWLTKLSPAFTTNEQRFGEMVLMSHFSSTLVFSANGTLTSMFEEVSRMSSSDFVTSSLSYSRNCIFAFQWRALFSRSSKHWPALGM